MAGQSAVQCLNDLSHIFVEQNLLPFQILQMAARRTNMDRRAPGRRFGVRRQARDRHSNGRQGHEDIDEPNAFFRQRQHESVMRRRHGADERCQMKAVRDLA
jgi:hypothetical protein